MDGDEGVMVVLQDDVNCVRVMRFVNSLLDAAVRTNRLTQSEANVEHDKIMHYVEKYVRGAGMDDVDIHRILKVLGRKIFRYVKVVERGRSLQGASALRSKKEEMTVHYPVVRRVYGKRHRGQNFNGHKKVTL